MVWTGYAAVVFFFFNAPAAPEIYTPSLTDALPIYHDRLAATRRRYRAASGGDGRPEALRDAGGTARADFTTAMDDDFNTREALAALFGLAREANRHEPGTLDSEPRDAVVSTFEELGGEVLGLFAPREAVGPSDAEIEALLKQRKEARALQDWTKSDTIRGELAEQGIEVQDTPAGVRWRRV